MEFSVIGKNKKRLKLIENLAKELGLTTKRLDKSEEQEISQKERSEKPYKLMEEMAEANVFSEIKAPVEWQREQRKDPSLPGRE